MYRAATAQELERLRTRHELDVVYRTLAPLGGKYNPWWSEPSAKADLDNVPRLLSDALARAKAVVDLASQPELRIRPHWLLDGLLLVIALVVAVFASLQANYFGKPFGTVPDYLAC